AGWQGRQDEHRGPGHVGIGDTGHGVGDAGAGGDEGHAEPTGEIGVSVGNVDGGPLVADVDDLDALGVERHPDRHEVAAAQPEDALDAPPLEEPGHQRRGGVGRQRRCSAHGTLRYRSGRLTMGDDRLAVNGRLPTYVRYSCPVPFSDRSQATREAILAAARNQFGARGFEATTIRSVAAEAGIHPSMVMRYYTNKDGLFDAAIDVDLDLPDLERVPARRRGAVLARHLVERWEGRQADEGLILLLRSLATNPAAAARARAVFAGQVLRLVERIVADPAEAPVRAAMVSSQVLGVALCRYVVKIPPLADMAPDVLVATLTPPLQHHLAGRYR